MTYKEYRNRTVSWILLCVIGGNLFIAGVYYAQQIPIYLGIFVFNLCFTIPVLISTKIKLNEVKGS